jgi:hypothetical protein
MEKIKKYIIPIYCTFYVLLISSFILAIIDGRRGSIGVMFFAWVLVLNFLLFIPSIKLLKYLRGRARIILPIGVIVLNVVTLSIFVYMIYMGGFC